MMTRKEFEKVADMLEMNVSWVKRLAPLDKQPNGRVMVENIARAFTRIAKESNPRFEEARFYAACGLNETGRVYED